MYAKCTGVVRLLILFARISLEILQCFNEKARSLFSERWGIGILTMLLIFAE